MTSGTSTNMFNNNFTNASPKGWENAPIRPRIGDVFESTGNLYTRNNLIKAETGRTNAVN